MPPKKGEPVECGAAPLFDIKANARENREEWEKQYVEQETKLLKEGVVNLATMRQGLKGRQSPIPEAKISPKNSASTKHAGSSPKK